MSHTRTPEQQYRELSEIANNYPSTRETVNRFLDYLKHHFSDWRNDENGKQIVDVFLSNLDKTNSLLAEETRNAIRNSAASLGILRGVMPPMVSQQEQSEIFLSTQAQAALHMSVDHIHGDRELFLFQKYYNSISSGNKLAEDGKSSSELLSVFRTQTRETQVFLRELGAVNTEGVNQGEPLQADGVLGANTLTAIETYFGIDTTDLKNTILLEFAKDELSQLKSIPNAELITKLEEATQENTTNLQRLYTMEFHSRFAKKGMFIKTNLGNRFGVYDADSNTPNPEFSGISQDNLQIIMMFLAAEGQDYADKTLSENITNNIFDQVITEYDFKNSSGQLWGQEDFVVNDVRTEDMVKANFALLSTDINTKITELKATNAKSSTTESQKVTNRLWIQKLEVAKIFAKDRSIFAENTALSFVQDYANDNEALAVHFRDNPRVLKLIKDPTSLENIDDFLGSQIPRILMAGILALLANFLPKGFREAAWAIIGVKAGLGMAQDAKKAGFDLPDPRSGGSNPQSDASTGGETLSAASDALKKLLTDAPYGLESRHELRYAQVVEENLKPDAGYIGERKTLDTIYLILSQDPVFGSKSKAEITNMTVADIQGIMSPYSFGILSKNNISGEDVIYTVRMLNSINPDTQDETGRDLFVEGQVNEATHNGLPTTIWINGFTEKNNKINLLVSQLSGISYGAEELRKDSTKAKVQKILGTERPDIISRLSQRVSDATEIEVLKDLPTAKNITTVITELTALQGTLSGDDQTRVGEIIAVYQELKEGLTSREKVESLLDEAHSYSGGFFRADVLKNTVNAGAGAIAGVVAYFGFDSRLAPTGFSKNNPTEIATLITDLKALNIPNLAGLTDENRLDLQKKVNDEIKKLERTLAASYTKLASDTSLSTTERQAFEVEGKQALITVINNDPDRALKAFEESAQGLEELKRSYANIDEYLGVIYKHSQGLQAMKILSELDDTQLTTPEAQKIHTRASEVMRDFETFKTNVSAERKKQSDNLDTYTSTTSGTPNASLIGQANVTSLESIAQNVAKIRATLTNENIITQARNWLNDLGVPNNQTKDYNDVLGLITYNVQQVDDTTNFDLKGDELIAKLVRVESEIQARRIELQGDFDVTVSLPTDILDVTQITAFATAVKQKLEAIKDFQNPAKGLKEKALQKQISQVVDMFADRASMHNINDSIEKLEALMTNYSILKDDKKLGNGGNERFEDTLGIKHREIVSADYEKMLDETLFGILNPNTAIFISKLYEKYDGRYSLLDPQLELITNPNASLRDIIETLSVISSWKINEMGNLGSGNPFDESAHTLFIKDVEKAKSGLEGAISKNEVRASITRKYGDFLVKLEELGII